MIQTGEQAALDQQESKGLEMEKRIVLASQSPRRKDILSMVIPEFDIVVDDSEEIVDEGISPEETVKTLAMQKALNVADKIEYDAIVIGADTVVSVDGEIFGKPIDQEDAKRMLKILSGRKNVVCTGFAVIDTKTGKTVCDLERTDVCFREMTDEEIDAYVKTGEPMDKAGAYGMQGIGGLFISGIKGDYFNVVGLPLCALAQVLNNKFGYKVF